MNKINEAIHRIKELECPTGNLENRVEEILEDYRVANRDEISVKRDKYLDKGDSQAYLVKISGQNQPIIVLAKSGYDDYVAKVTDVYSKY
ncbi:hypothetical protein ACJDT4_10830 [Clostridium neuense]|uniref:Uncharacterized protein n=1 Tax=Clostridium neuense TaxID=1728934 RepID=A0ABW8TFB5_9CLOT